MRDIIAHLQALTVTAIDSGDLASAITLDNEAEGFGMHSDDRKTCFTCQSLADHAHDVWSGQRISLEEYEARKARKFLR